MRSQTKHPVGSQGSKHLLDDKHNSKDCTAAQDDLDLPCTHNGLFVGFAVYQFTYEFSTIMDGAHI